MKAIGTYSSKETYHMMNRKMTTRDRGPFRILLEGNDDPEGRNQYFEVEVYAADAIAKEILWVRDARIAYNRALRAYGQKLLNVTNLETGRMVVGGSGR